MTGGAEHSNSGGSASQARLELQWINHLLDAQPHDAALWLRKAMAFRSAMVTTLPHRVRLERVRLWFEQSLREEPDNWIHHHNLAVTLRDLNRHEEALQAAQKAVDLAPGKEATWSLLVMTLVRVGRYGHARTAFDEAARNGCPLPTDLLGVTSAGRRVAEMAQAESLPEGPDVRQILGDPQAARESLLDGRMTFVFEAADPELFVFQAEFGELVNLGLSVAAEELWISFELKHGATNLSRSCLARLKVFAGFERPQSEVSLDAAFPLLDIATKHHGFEFLEIVSEIFREGGAGRFIQPVDVNDFDEQTRWHLKRLGDSGYRLDHPAASVKPIPRDLLRVWQMASVNFIVARRLGHPLLTTYTATTLAELYTRLGLQDLPFILYKIAAAAAEEAGQWDYFVNAHGKCSLILQARDKLGPAAAHLEKALRRADTITPLNRYDLFCTLAEVYGNLSEFSRARELFHRAQEVAGVPEQLREQAHSAEMGIDLIARQSGVELGIPPVLCQGLSPQYLTLEVARGPLTFSYTSRHELYDSLVQAFDNILRVRRSLTERAAGYTFLQKNAALAAALIETALDLELPAHALQHLEAQKNLILSNRLRFLLREKPADLPTELWEELQRLVALHRRITEGGHEPGLHELLESSLEDVESAIAVTLWTCGQTSRSATRRIEQKLAFSEFPRRIDCADPEHTLLLEFYPGACFLISPTDPSNPEVVRLPAATPEELQRLGADLHDLIGQWIEDGSQCRAQQVPSALAAARWTAFLSRFDEVLYAPLARRLNAGTVRKICLIPHRVSHTLPLNLLGLANEPQGSLGQRFELSFAPSLRCLASLCGEPVAADRVPGHVLIVANPVPCCPPAVCRNPSHDCYSLGGAEKECTALRSLVEAAGLSITFLAGDAATISNVTTRLGEADLVHIAAHALYDPRSPEKSGLLLSAPAGRTGPAGHYFGHGRNTSGEPGTATVGEILTLESTWKDVDLVRCRLVNLSACSTAMIDTAERSDEFYGIANGFLYAGARSVLSSLWPVHDAAAEVFSRLFYESLLTDRSTPAAALRYAVSRLRSTETAGGRPFEHPFFWAGYRLIGLA